VSQLIGLVRRHVADNKSPIGFETSGTTAWPVWYRYLTVDGKRAYELGNICNTCAFYFERMEGANRDAAIKELADALAKGVTCLDETLLTDIDQMMPSGDYMTLLLNLTPRAVTLGGESDYFVSERQANWGLDGFWGLPHHPRVPYYRTGVRSISGMSGVRNIDGRARLFEFIVPMYPRNWLDQRRLAAYEADLGKGALPTAIGISLLDVKSPAVKSGNQETEDHWCLAHYLLDGHHKVESASLTGRPISMISFLAIKQGVANAHQIDTTISKLDWNT